MVCKSKPFHFSAFRNPFDVEAKASAWRPREPVSRDEGVARLWFPAASSLPGVDSVGLRGGKQARAPSHGKSSTAQNPPTHHHLNRAVSSQSFRLSLGF